MTLQQLIEDMGYETRSYSGRGMYGKECLGVLLTIARPVEEAMRIGFEIADYNSQIEDDLEDRIPLPKTVATDSMGLDTIIYFPGVEYKEQV